MATKPGEHNYLQVGRETVSPFIHVHCFKTIRIRFTTNDVLTIGQLAWTLDTSSMVPN
jgi:hypothetical protein